MRKSEYTPINEELSEDRRKLINRTLNKWRKGQKPKSYEELLARIDLFFKTIEELKIVPSEKLLALCLAEDRSTLYRHKNGINCSAWWADAIRKACDLIEVQTQLAVTEDSLNPIYAIWLEKSRYGYSDQLGQSEAERQTRLLTTEQPYRLPQDLLREYSALPDKTRSETISAVQNVQHQTQPPESQHSATKPPDIWMNVPDGFDEDSEPFY